MAKKFTFTSPEGKQITVEGPDDATQEQAFKIAQDELAKQPGSVERAVNAMPAIPRAALKGAAGLAENVGSMASNFAGSVAGAVAGAPQYVGSLMRGENGDAAHDTFTRIRDAMTYQPRTEAGQGLQKLASVVGQPVSRAVDWLGDPTGTGDPFVADLIKTAAPIAVGNAGAAVAEGAFPPPKLPFRPELGNGPKATTLRQGHEAGYNVSPSREVNGQPVGTGLSRVAEAIGGKTRTEAARAMKNQPVTQRLAGEEVGVPELTPATLEQARGEANAKYKALDSIQEPLNLRDPQYINDVTALTPPKLGPLSSEPLADIGKLQKSLTAGATDSVASAVERVKDLRAQANNYYRAAKSGVDPNAEKLAHAHADAAEALDDLLQRTLEKSPDPQVRQMVAEYKAARVRLAKINVVDRAMNKGSGEVNPANIKQQGTKRNLTGNLDLIARMQAAFPKDVRATEGLSPPAIDFADWISGFKATIPRYMLRSYALSPGWAVRGPTAGQVTGAGVNTPESDRQKLGGTF